MSSSIRNAFGQCSTQRLTHAIAWKIHRNWASSPHHLVIIWTLCGKALMACNCVRNTQKFSLISSSIAISSGNSVTRHVAHKYTEMEPHFLSNYEFTGALCDNKLSACNFVRNTQKSSITSSRISNAFGHCSITRWAHAITLERHRNWTSSPHN